MNLVNPDHPYTDPGDGRVECETCGKWVHLVIHSCKGVPVTYDAAMRAYAAALERVAQLERTQRLVVYISDRSMRADPFVLIEVDGDLPERMTCGLPLGHGGMHAYRIEWGSASAIPHTALPDTTDDHPYKTLCSCGAWNYDHRAHVERESDAV